MQGGARQAAPTNWLASLFSARNGDARSASTYAAQSPYYVDGKWDVPEGHWWDAEADKLDGESDEDYQERRPIDTWKGANEYLQQRFMDIFNDVLLYFGLSEAHKALATESTDDEYDDIGHEYDKPGCDPPNFSTRPDIVILGEDVRQLPRVVDSYSRDMSVDLNTRRELYQGCIAVAKVKKVAGEGGQDRMLEKLATAAEYVSRSLKVPF